MKKNEEYWLNLYKEGKIEIDFENGIVWSYLMDIAGGLKNPKKRQLGANFDKSRNHYMASSAGPSRKERYNILLHRLIWICANGEIPDEINHKNGIKWDNRLENLELATKSTNAIHSYRVLGNKSGNLRGEEHGRSILKWDEVREARKLWATGSYKKSELAQRYGVHFCTIRDVLSNRTWKE